MPTKNKPTQLDRIESRLGLIESSLAVLLSGATFMQELEKTPPTPEGLHPGDYTDASKEVADALTAMGWEWFSEKYRGKCCFIEYGSASRTMCQVQSIGTTHLTPAEFLASAAVTANALGLDPVVEKWVPKVGDWVSHQSRDGSDLRKVGQVRGLTPSISLGAYVLWAHDMTQGEYVCNLRPATDSEVQQHLAEQEARANAEKLSKLKFGARVQCRNKSYRIVSEEPSVLGVYAIFNDSGWNTDFAKADELTVIEQP